jgi:hypothetical protein
MTQVSALKVRKPSVASIGELLERHDPIAIFVEDGEDFLDDLGCLSRVRVALSAVVGDGRVVVESVWNNEAKIRVGMKERKRQTSIGLAAGRGKAGRSSEIKG